MCVAPACWSTPLAQNGPGSASPPGTPTSETPGSDAPAVPSSKPGRPGDPTFLIDWGFGTMLPAHRCVPVRITLTGGTEAFTGTMTLKYRGDSTQSMSLTVPVAATPGKTSVFTPVVAFPGAAEKIEAVLADRAGRVVRRVTYSDNPGETEMPLPPVRGERAPLVIGVGSATSSAGSVGTLRLTHIAIPEVPGQEEVLETATTPAATLPMLAWGYDGVSAVVLESDAVRVMDPRSAAALREWVLEGGWLVVVASGADDTWSSWLPPTGAGDGGAGLLSVGGPVKAETPGTLAKVVSTDPKMERGETGRFAATTWNSYWGGWRAQPMWMHGPTVEESLQPPTATTPPPEPAPAAAPVEIPIDAASEIVARWIRLTAEGRRAGWSIGLTRGEPVAWTDTGPQAPPLERDEEGLLAQGPVGYGWVTVIGFDPRRASVQMSNGASRRVWAEVFALNARPRPPGQPGTRSLRGSRSSLSTWAMWTQPAANATSLALDAVAVAAPPGRRVFLLVALAAGAVPLLIGPVDYLVLRRKRLAHRSWLTALGWISGASLGAWMMPLVVRSSSTTVSRLEVVDVMMPADGTSGEPLALAAGITGVFSAESATATLAGLPAGATVRSISSDAPMWNRREAASTPGAELPLTQAGPGLDEESAGDAWGGVNPGVSGVAPFGDRTLATAWRLWTFRAVEDRARVAPTVRAAVERIGIRTRVRVTGLAPGAAIRSAAVVIGGEWRGLQVVPGVNGAGVNGAGVDSGVVLEAAEAVDRQMWEPRPTVRNDYGYPYPAMNLRGTLLETPGAALITAAQDRGELIEPYVESGVWDAVYLHVTDLPATVSLDAGSIGSRQAVFRIVIPRRAEARGGEAKP
jgi:hypothetical protein